MRIYLACTVRGDRSGLEAARLIAQRLTALGHDVLTSHLLADNVDEAEASLGNREVFERDLGWLDASDALIAEASGSTYGVGFEVGYIVGRAPHSGQRAFVLCDDRRWNAVSRMLSGNTAAACTTVRYASLDDIAAFVEREFGAPTSA